MTIYARRLAPELAQALGIFRVVYLQGPRQAGKSTLARTIADAEDGRRLHRTLDETAALLSARADPAGFIAGLGARALIDEVQRVPELLLEIKRVVDAEPAAGSFLLTGSASLLTAPRVLDALPGRLVAPTLWPLAQSEIEGAGGTLVASLLEGAPVLRDGAERGRDAIAARLARGGFPEAIPLAARDRDRWHDAYLQGLAARDLRELADARRTRDVPLLLRILAARSASLVEIQPIGRAIGWARPTVEAYLDLLETLFMIDRIPAWRPGLAARAVASPKLHVVDSGLLCHLLGASAERVAHDEQVIGRALESFVVGELRRELGWMDARATLYHYRDRDGNEVDAVIEAADGRIVGIEVKASETPRPSDARGLRHLAGLVGDRFVAGVVLHLGGSAIPLGDRITALPVSSLWSDPA